MTAKEYKHKWEKAKVEAAKYKFQFAELKREIKTMAFSEKREAKKELKGIRTKLRQSQKDANYYRHQYILLSKSEGKHISGVSVAIGEIKKQLKK